jgi:hypothetical protein
MQVGSLTDEKKAWPAHGYLHLDGFSFRYLGGEGESGREMRERPMDWWDDWVRLDLKYSPSPYVQLAAALTASGDHNDANKIRYLGRQRERDEAWRQSKWGTWLFESALCYVAGYGIGFYTFHVLFWVLGLSLVGAALLWWKVPEASTPNRGCIWCFGASLSRLLPVIEISKEFTDFFNDPKRERLNNTQSFLFSVLAVIGWLLGAVLVVAVSGLTAST